jgi:hypothetical protein
VKTNVRILTRLAAFALVALAAACTSDATPPTSATVIVEADTPEPIFLIVASRFEVLGNGELALTNGDTIEITGNYNDKFQLNSEARFTAKLINEGELPADVRLSVLIDGSVQFDDRATILNGGFLQYVYRFRDGGAFGI